MILPISSASTAAPEAADSIDGLSKPSRNDTIDQHEFLMLFISQLQNQDPMNPIDTNGMTDQLAQFSSLEQLFNINSKLETLGSVLDRRDVDPLSFLGREVSVPGDTVAVEDGKATPVMLEVPGDARAVELTIVGPGGHALRTIALGDQPSGELEFVFDGKDATGGQVPDGNYTVRITARDSEAAALSVDTFIRGTVTGVDLTAEPPVLLLGTRRVSLTEVREIRSAAGEGNGT